MNSTYNTHILYWFDPSKQQMDHVSMNATRFTPQDEIPDPKNLEIFFMLSSPTHSYFHILIPPFIISFSSSKHTLLFSLPLIQAWSLCVLEQRFPIHVAPSTRVLPSVYSHLETVWWIHKKTRAHRTLIQSAGESLPIAVVTKQLMPCLS